jgi:hypothetical protein
MIPMVKITGISLIIIGLVFVVVSIFVDMFSIPDPSVNVSRHIAWVIANYQSYWNMIITLPTSLSVTIWSLFWVLAPILFVVGIVFVFCGLNTSKSATIGSILILICPIAFLLDYVIIPTIINQPAATILAGFYLLIIGIVLILFGARKNRAVI